MTSNSCYDNDVSVLSLAHDWKYGFDDVDVCEEVDLEDLIDQASCSASLSEFFNRTDHGYTNEKVSSHQSITSWVITFARRA
jgi:hypothetical protein